MKMILTMIVILLSILPCSLICASNMWLCLLGIAYMGVWMWIANAIVNAYERKDKADA